MKHAQLQALGREFDVLSMKESEKVDDYFSKTLTITNKMKVHGERMAQNVIVEKILRSMTPRFNYMVFSNEESNNLTTMTIDELQSSFLVHVQRMHGQKEEEYALKVTNTERFGVKDEYNFEKSKEVYQRSVGKGLEWKEATL